MRIKVVELLDNITAAAVDQDVDKLLALKSKLEGVNRYIQSPNVSPWAFIQIVEDSETSSRRGSRRGPVDVGEVLAGHWTWYGI